MTSSVDQLTHTLLTALVLSATLLAIGFVLGLVASIVHSAWKVIVGKATLVLPLQGSAKGALVSTVLAQQLDAIEREWIDLSRSINELEDPHPDAPIYAELGRTLADDYLSAKSVQEFIDEHPIDPGTVGTITFAGVSFTPQTLLSLLYAIRGKIARRAIRGTLHEFDTLIRLAVEFHYPTRLRYRSPSDPQSHRLPRRSGHRLQSQARFVRTLDSKAPIELLQTIDDAAFAFGRFRLGSPAAATRWEAFKAAATGYLAQHRFLVNGDLSDRERAIESYERATVTEQNYALAHYNLGVLLYARYTESDNSRAIEHLAKAAEITGPRTRMKPLALAMLSACYCQQVHRYGGAIEPSVSLAEDASAKAFDLDSELEETRFARAFAAHMRGKLQEATHMYEQVARLPGDSAEERQMKSFALNNKGFIELERGEHKEAESSLRRALNFCVNKMAHANLGALYRLQGRYDAALDEYREALRLDPKYINAINEMGMVHITTAASADNAETKREELVRARALHERALLLVPLRQQGSRAELHRRFEKVYRENGLEAEAKRESEEAAADARLAPQIAPSSPVAEAGSLTTIRNDPR